VLLRLAAWAVFLLDGDPAAATALADQAMELLAAEEQARSYLEEGVEFYARPVERSSPTTDCISMVERDIAFFALTPPSQPVSDQGA
jgi:hypothetical protein